MVSRVKCAPIGAEPSIKQKLSCPGIAAILQRRVRKEKRPPASQKKIVDHFQ
jgi:hypothetical protein